MGQSKAAERRIRQASQVANVSYIVPMDALEARTAVVEIRAHLKAADSQIVELHERQGWKALGYRSWKDCVHTEFNISRTHGYELLASALVRQNLRQIPTNVSDMSDTLPNNKQAVILAKLPDAAAQRAVYDEALKQSRGKPTARQVEGLVKARKPWRVGDRVRHEGRIAVIAAVLDDGTLRLRPVVSSSALEAAWRGQRLHRLGADPLSDPAPDPPEIGVLEEASALRARCRALLERVPDRVVREVLRLLAAAQDESG